MRVAGGRILLKIELMLINTSLKRKRQLAIPTAGFEPARPQGAEDFKSSVSTVPPYGLMHPLGIEPRYSRASTERLRPTQLRMLNLRINIIATHKLNRSKQ